MKSLILFACVIVLIFQTGRVDDSPISMMVPNTTRDIQNTEMNFTQIQAGDYSSLLGTWKQIAYADNRFDGTGMQWYMGKLGNRVSSLSVSTDKIAYNGSAMVMQGNTLTDDAGSHLLSFVNDGTVLFVFLNTSATIDWSVTFYQKGAANNYEPNNGVQIDNTKNLIVVWYSGMRVLTVFGQE